MRVRFDSTCDSNICRALQLVFCCCIIGCLLLVDVRYGSIIFIPDIKKI